ncbi:MAG: hypothetical protein LBK95_02990 [Bifidobacteriaceae bacterium]|jgi:antitoxin VapB|nr:hypothetical protein [Bifidobacteriaceae bacterium]
MNGEAQLQTTVFMSGNSQAVRLPAPLRFDTRRVWAWKDAATGDVTLSARRRDWQPFLDLVRELDVPADFLASDTRATNQDRDPLDGADL